MRALLILASSAYLAGCVSQPSTPKERADMGAAMGLMLLAASAQENDSAARAMWRIKISPAALKVVGSVQEKRKTLGRWPKTDEVRLPDGVSEITLTEVDAEAELVVRSPTAVLLRCTLSPDGTIAISPPLEQLLGILQSATRR